jgi:type VI secretion system ImpM family protein
MPIGGIGFFGKVPHKGDFVRCGLPESFVAPWDRWIRATLVHAEETLGAGWRDAFAEAPVWRFVLGPNACGPQAWAGVIASSADRFGRAYPLTLALALSDKHDVLLLAETWRGGYDSLTDLAQAMSREEGAFDAAIQRLAEIQNAFPLPHPSIDRHDHQTEPEGGDPIPEGASQRIALTSDSSLVSCCRAVLSRAGTSATLMWSAVLETEFVATVGRGLPDPARQPTIWESVQCTP